jgi:hypothetical protein
MFDHDIREFDSPLDPRPSGDSGVTPPKPVVVTIPGLDEDRALAIAFEELRKLPVPRRNLLLGHLTALLKLHPADRAVIAVRVQPYLSDAQVAALVGKSERQLRRYSEYQRIKAADVADAMNRLQRRWYMADDCED